VLVERHHDAVERALDGSFVEALEPPPLGLVIGVRRPFPRLGSLDREPFLDEDLSQPLLGDRGHHLVWTRWSASLESDQCVYGSPTSWGAVDFNDVGTHIVGDRAWPSPSPLGVQGIDAGFVEAMNSLAHPALFGIDRVRDLPRRAPLRAHEHHQGPPPRYRRPILPAAPDHALDGSTLFWFESSNEHLGGTPASHRASPVLDQRCLSK